MEGRTDTLDTSTDYRPIECWHDRKRNESGRYIKVHVPEHPRNFGGWVHEHTLVAEQKLGRLLQDEETVHHLCDRHDNRPEAIVVVEEQEHVRIHR